jgi:hypothetical protein
MVESAAHRAAGLNLSVCHQPKRHCHGEVWQNGFKPVKKFGDCIQHRKAPSPNLGQQQCSGSMHGRYHQVGLGDWQTHAAQMYQHLVVIGDRNEGRTRQIGG